MMTKRVAVLVLIGLIIRIAFIYFFPEPLMHDQLQYYGLSLGLLKDFFFVDSYRLYGYPFLLSVVFTVFGSQNVIPAIMLNVAMDILTALGVYFLTVKCLKDKKAALISMSFYLFTPFTLPYIGLVLTEVTAVFFMVLIFTGLYKLRQRRNLIWLAFVSLLLGYYPQIKPGFIFFSAALLIFTLFWWIQRKFPIKTAAGIVLSLFCFVLPFIHNIVGNMKYFQSTSPLSADNAFVRELYVSLFAINELPPLGRREKTGDWYPGEILTIYTDYSLPRTGEQKNAMADKYFKLSTDEILKDPKKFISWRIVKLWHVWEKRYLLYYDMTNIPKWVDRLIYASNISLLVCSVLGMAFRQREIMGKKDREGRYFLFISLLLFIYISISHAFSMTEERFSLPAYPILCIFAGYGIYSLIRLKTGKN